MSTAHRIINCLNQALHAWTGLHHRAQPLRYRPHYLSKGGMRTKLHNGLYNRSCRVIISIEQSGDFDMVGVNGRGALSGGLHAWHRHYYIYVSGGFGKA
eukprot:scaffold609193_cov46-Prasinocladus_malaysianus.AAC.1